MARVRELTAEIPDSYWPNQYANESNAAAHTTTTMPEIEAVLGEPPAYLYCAVSTCGTLAGCAEFVRSRGWPTKVIAVDAMGSAIFPGEPPGSRVLPGLGAGIRPRLAETVDPDDVIRVTDADCVRGCRLLLRQEGILAGASSGGIVAAMVKVTGQSRDVGRRHVMVLPDRGERYCDTVFDQGWVSAQLGVDQEAARWSWS